ncbi:MAG: hypothetical protein ACTHMS_10160 [Jatrophihabitans sp.]|uniref:hypothetical protein n=1 Tax=Jatrophihabitans sp. TaxID=1932789 RepID=UPI003F811F87
MDGVAIASVISSAAVAVVATGAQVSTAIGDRRASWAMKREELAWPARMAVLQQVADVAAHLRQLLRAQMFGGDQAESAAELRAALDRLQSLVGPVEMYASPELSEALDLLRYGLRDLKSGSPEQWQQLDDAQRAKEAALDAQDWDRAAEQRRAERRALRALGLPDRAGGLEALVEQVDRVITAVRADVSPDPRQVRRAMPKRAREVAQADATVRRLTARRRAPRDAGSPGVGSSSTESNDLPSS